MAKKNIDLAVVLHDDCDYKDWLVELKERFYSHRLKASCATNGYFYKLYAPLQANCPQLADDFKLLFLIPWDHHRRIIDKCKGNGATDNQRPFNATSMPMWYIRKFTECKPQWFSTLCIRERTCWLL